MSSEMHVLLCSNSVFVLDECNGTVIKDDADISQAMDDYQNKQEINIIIKDEAARCVVPVGLLLNLVFLFVVVRVPSMRSVVNVYLGNLAVADGVFLTGVLISGSCPDGSSVFRAVQGCITASSKIASYFIVMALAVERFYAVCHPLTVRAESSKGLAVKRLALIWIIAFITGSALDLTWRLEGQIVTLNIVSFLLLFLNVVGLITVTSLYTHIVKKLQQKPRMTSTGDEQQLLRRVVFMLIINTALFFLLNVSIITAVLLTLIILNNPDVWCDLKALQSLEDLEMVRFILHLINCSVDPLVYSGMNPDYRAALVEAFSCLCPKCTCNWHLQETPKQPKEKDDIQEQSSSKEIGQPIELQEIVHSQDTVQETAEPKEVQGEDNPLHAATVQVDLQEIHRGQSELMPSGLSVLPWHKQFPVDLQFT